NAWPQRHHQGPSAARRNAQLCHRSHFQNAGPGELFDGGLPLRLRSQRVGGESHRGSQGRPRRSLGRRGSLAPFLPRLVVSGFMATLSQTTQQAETFPAAREQAPVKPVTARNVAVDAYRGLVMVLMMAEVLRLSHVSAAYPNSLFCKILALNQTHTEWFGCSLHDTIQPGFSFLVGVALPYSIASRIAKGARLAELFWHALWRSLVLVALGVFLRSMDHSMTYFTFEDTLSQIGFGYPFLFLLGFYSLKVKSLKWVWVLLGLILFAYWLVWALYPAAPANFDWQSVGVSPAWSSQHNFTGFAAHWNKNYNFGNRFDHWFLNLFPREQR